MKTLMGRVAGWCTMAAVTLTASVALPAAAAPVKPTVDLEHLVLVSGGWQSQFIGLRRSGAAVTLHDVTVTVDVSQVSRFAVVEPFLRDDRCTSTGSTFTCQLGDDKIDKGGYAALISLTAHQLDSAVPGDTGSLTTTVTTREFGSVVRRSTVTVAEPVSFEPGGAVHRQVRPGQRIQQTLTLRNTGSRPITSSVMWFYREAMFTYPRVYSNCQYGTPGCSAASTTTSLPAPPTGSPSHG